VPDTLTTITTFINSPPGQLVAGAALGGIVWKFFDRVEAVLNDDTKLEIAVWLLGVKTASKVQTWPNTFAKVFDRVFGTTHLSWKCFERSALISGGATAILLIVYLHAMLFVRPILLLDIFICTVVPDYLSVLETRLVLKAMTWTTSSLVWLGLIAIDLVGTGFLSLVTAKVLVGPALLLDTSGGVTAFPHRVMDGFSFLFVASPLSGFLAMVVPSQDSRFVAMNPIFMWPMFLSLVWLWLYAGSGFLLKFARRFDIGFQWFNRHFDIEKKPLQSIGLVAGALVAVVYWAVVIVSRMI
jgi:hypothetical protein